jgi:EF-hand domain pair
LFKKIDSDKSGLLSRAELRAFIIGIKLDELDLSSDEEIDDAVDKVIDDFDSSGDNQLNSEEFIRGLCKYLREAKHKVSNSGAYSSKFIHDFHLVSQFCSSIMML